MGRTRNIYNILVGKPQAKWWLERPRCEQEDNIKMDVSEIGCEDLNRMGLVQDTNKEFLEKILSVQHGDSHHQMAHNELDIY